MKRPEYLYHGTSKNCENGIKKLGLNNNWMTAVKEMALSYAEIKSNQLKSTGIIVKLDCRKIPENHFKDMGNGNYKVYRMRPEFLEILDVSI